MPRTPPIRKSWVLSLLLKALLFASLTGPAYAQSSPTSESNSSSMESIGLSEFDDPPPGTFGEPIFGRSMSTDLSSDQFSETDGLRSGLNFNQFPSDFVNGLTLRQGRWGVKFGGYVKADLIHDFRAIGSTDFFDPATIPIGAPQRSDSRFHARQTRLNMDARWLTDSGEPLRMMVEGDFFGNGDTFRLRHAYGEYQNFIIGQTWTTFTHRAALPNTLDVVGDVASVGRRQAQVRYTKHLVEDRWIFAAAIEDSTVTADDNLLSLGQPRSPLADLICRIRFNGENGQLQLATLVRQLGFQPNQSSVITRPGQGLNATGFVDLTKKLRLYGGILWGDGIGSYRDLPDIALLTPTTGTALETIAWYSGAHHQWSERWSSNVTYSQGNVDNSTGQLASSIRELQYLAVNLIWQPTPYTFAGIEGVWGKRTNLDLENSDASRVMMSFGFLLP